jgi:[acyl-carrier-protein] S-malonyltransferase
LALQHTECERKVSERRLFFVFPGQGAQYVGMGADLVEQFDVAREVYERATAVLGYDIGALSFGDADGKLDSTRYTQPALLTHEYACLQVFRSLAGEGAQPVMAGGHSLGEYTALVASGVLSFEDALALVQERGRLMSELGRGGMLATTLDVDSARSLADRHYCGVAGCNLLDQTVVAGDDADLDALTEDLGRSYPGKRAIRLNTEGAFHTHLMVHAAMEYRAVLDNVTFAEPAVAVLSNYTGSVHEPGADSVRSRLFFQLFNPVQWVSCMRTAMETGFDTVIEFGGGIGKGATPEEKRPNLEGMIKKAMKAQSFEAQYLPAINAAGIRAAADSLGAG